MGVGISAMTQEEGRAMNDLSLYFHFLDVQQNVHLRVV